MPEGLNFGIDKLETAEEARQRAQANWVGTVSNAVWPCNCADCQKGLAKLLEMGESVEGRENFHLTV